VIQTGEFDYAWNLQVEDEILKRMEQGGKGKVDIVAAATSSTSSATSRTRGRKWTRAVQHQDQAPLPLGPAVRQALNLVVDRAAIQESIYGRTGISTANYLNAPARFQSKSAKWEFSVDKANQDPGRGRLEARQRRRPREGRRQAQDGLPDVDQRVATEDPSGRETGRRESRDRHGDQVRDGLGLFLVRPGQPRHVPALLYRHPDVHHHHDAAGSRTVHDRVHVVGSVV